MTEATGPRLVATYRSRQEAEAVADTLRDAGVAAGDLHIGDRSDQSAAAVGEQRQEMDDAWSVAPSAVISKEQAQGARAAIPVGVVVGGVLGLLLGLVLPDAMPLWGRLLLGAAIGAAFGGVVTMVIGAGLGARGPATPGAAQGTTLSVAGDDDRLRQLLVAGEPVRIDRLDPGTTGAENHRATSTVATEEDPRDESALGYLHDRVQDDPKGDWSTVAPDQPRADERPDGFTGS